MISVCLHLNIIYLSLPGDLPAPATVGQARVKLLTMATMITERDTVMAETTQIILTLMRLTPGPVILTEETMIGTGEMVRTEN